MKTTEIRQRFLDYFARHGHEVVPSSSLVPGDDPTLLFTNAGMVQFKDTFLGLEERPYRRAVTAQRCVRAGGKHNDLENVGYTARHHTFFEMLGNFSFGDYFKREAIRFAWDLLVNEFGIDPARLWVTVYAEDDEAAAVWCDEIGVSKERFTRIGDKPGRRYESDNFWAMGDTGPCGPCSEIFYDHGPGVEGGPPGTPEEDGDRYVEIWNLVFMQYNRDAAGKMTPLPKPSVDTGMGLERMAAVLQGVHSNYEIDLFQALIRAASEAVGTKNLDDKSLRVIADHIRSSAFLIVDGVTPSNEGRGYVLRRIIRRAIRHGYQLGQREPFMQELVAPLVEQMGDAYPELRKRAGLVERVLRQEGERFNETLEHGLRILDEEIGRMPGRMIPGELVFRLYDTYGFPVDLTADVARERGLELDMQGFEKEMAAQRERARAASQFVQHDQLQVQGVERTEFVGYTDLAAEAEVVALVRGSEQVERLAAGEEGIVILDRTPFYAESGGQVGDRGRIRVGDAIFEVSGTRYLANKVIGHFGVVRLGEIATGQQGRAEVSTSDRDDCARNHSATHLLHAALKRVLGDHVQQKGSLVEPRRLRFDFSHYEAMTPGQVAEVERLVNREIRRNEPVETRVMELEAAREAGAAALFGEKYDTTVRVVGMGDFSLELCGGTHASRTGDIGCFKILSEGGVAAGVRRIEAVTGEGAEGYIRRQFELLDRVAAAVKSGRGELEEKVGALVARSRELDRQVRELQAQLAMAGGGTASGDAVREVNGVKVMVVRQDGADAKALRATIDRAKEQLGSGLVVVGGEREGKVTLIAGVTRDLTQRFHAGSLIREIVPLVGGRGGGKPDMAQGGGGDASGLDRALAAVYDWVERQ